MQEEGEWVVLGCARWKKAEGGGRNWTLETQSACQKREGHVGVVKNKYKKCIVQVNIKGVVFTC